MKRLIELQPLRRPDDVDTIGKSFAEPKVVANGIGFSRLPQILRHQRQADDATVQPVTMGET
jgi:hypothetical protein